MKEFLKILSFKAENIKTVSSGKECIKLFENNEYFDIILMDINMPEIDGYQATKTLRNNKYNGIIIAITGMTGEQEYRKAYQSGMNFILIKPINLSYLENILKYIKIL